jgi:hypothetical protein
MDLSTITIAQFKGRFYRDFQFENQNPTQGQPVPDNFEDIVQDLDIQNAFNDAALLLNQGLFACNDAAITQGYLYLAAHCLSLNIQAADSGINSTGTGSFPVASRSVGSVSESYKVPEAYDDPILAQYAQTAYGQKYLAFVMPYLRGNVNSVWGGALP